MKRNELEHIIRAAAANASVRDIVVVGSQAILGTYSDAPAPLTISMEADVFPLEHSERSIVIDGAMGELSLFHTTFGYYAHGVDETTAVVPENWRTRLVRVDTPQTMGAVGWCLEIHDLAVSKLAAGREKDFNFVRVMIENKLASSREIIERLAITNGFAEAARQRAALLVRSWADDTA